MEAARDLVVAVFRWYWMEIVGAVIVGIVTVQLLVVLFGQVQQIRRTGEQQQLSLALLHQRIGAANALRIRRKQTHLIWNGERKFVVTRKTQEAENVCSFYLSPHDGKQLPQFQPGQYLTFKIHVPGQSKPVVRCYSLSDSPFRDYYRVTIKRVPPPPDKSDVPAGLISNYFLDHVKVGDFLDVQAPRGNFTLDPTQNRPAVLIGGGVGITPLVSMLSSIVDHKAERDVWLIYGVRNRRDHAMKDYIDELNQQHERTRVITCYSQPLANDTRGPDYEFAERISVSLLKRVLDSNNYDFYVCGPPPMMSSLLKDLAEWGVPKDRIFSEAFGPASGKAIGSVTAEREPSSPIAGSPQPTVATQNVTFGRSSKTLKWDGSFGNLLDCILDSGIQIDSGCRAGSCGTCVVAIKSGRVRCTSESHTEAEEGTCLTCISVPENDLVLDI
jgi:hypothetical protein